MKVLIKTGSMNSELLKKSIIKTLKKVFIEILNKLAPMKKKFVKENQAPYMTKALRKVIIRRLELETKYFKLKINDTLKTYKKQKNCYSRLYKKESKNFENR